MNSGVGNRIYSSVEFRDAITQAFADPTTVKFKVRAPSGTETVYTFGVDANVTKQATGRYRGYFDVGNADGDWYARWTGEGALVAACEDPVPIEKSVFTSP
jgi:hypothetical protein